MAPKARAKGAAPSQQGQQDYASLLQDGKAALREYQKQKNANSKKQDDALKPLTTLKDALAWAEAQAVRAESARAAGKREAAVALSLVLGHVAVEVVGKLAKDARNSRTPAKISNDDWLKLQERVCKLAADATDALRDAARRWAVATAAPSAR